MNKQEHPINLWERIIWLAFAVLGCIGILVFLATTAQLYWQDAAATDFWNLATAVFTFFGVLLTAGAAFATVAAVISYFSVNQKLKEAKSSLKKFKQLDQERKQLQAELETMAAYQAVTQDLQQHDATDKQSKQKSLQVALQILANPQAGFEARLKARAIIQDDKIYREFEQVRAEPSEEAWQQIIAMRQENLAVWKLLFQAASKADDAYDKAQNNYATALFNYGVALSFYGNCLRKQNETDKAISQWQQAGQQYALVLEMKADKYADKHKAAYNWGLALDDEAQAVANGDLESARVLWKTAGEKYQQALDIKSDMYKTANNWLIAIRKEANHLPNAAQIELWEQAKTQVAELQNHSSEHRQSEVIQNLLNKIDAEINKLSP